MIKMEKRALRSPFLIVNPKAYIYGQESLDLALVCERLTQEFDIDIVFTAQHADLRMIAEDLAEPHRKIQRQLFTEDVRLQLRVAVIRVPAVAYLTDRKQQKNRSRYHKQSGSSKQDPFGGAALQRFPLETLSTIPTSPSRKMEEVPP